MQQFREVSRTRTIYSTETHTSDALYISGTGHTLDTCFKEHHVDITHQSDKSIAKHFNQTGHTIHNTHAKGLWLLFTDSVNDRKDMKSHLVDQLGSRKPGGNECKTTICGSH